MEFNLREYKALKTINYLKNHRLFFFFNGINQNCIYWVKTEQELKNINFSYYQLYNKTSSKIFQKSIYKNITVSISSITFFIKPRTYKQILLKKKLLELNTFVFLALKLNNQIYSLNQIEYTNSLNYNENKRLLYQFNLANIKYYFLIK